MVYGEEAVANKVVMHKCDNPACYRFDHLQLGSDKDNAQDMAKKFRAPKQLSKEQTWEIIDSYEAGLTGKETADEVGCSEPTVSKIIKRYLAGRYD